jgi:hypothetical protein
MCLLYIKNTFDYPYHDRLDLMISNRLQLIVILCITVYSNNTCVTYKSLT